MPEHWDSPMILRAAATGGFLRINEAFRRELGLTREHLLNQPLLAWIHPDDRDELGELLASGSGRIRARHRTVDGAWYELEWRLRKFDGEAVAMGREPVLQAPEADESGRVRRSMDETLEAMARVVEGKNPGRRCSILLVDAAKERIAGGAGPSLPTAYNEAVEGLLIGPGVGSCGTAAYWNVPVVVEDIHQDVLWRDLRGAADLAGVRACWSQPVTTTSGEVLGAMALYSDQPAAPTRPEMDGLEIAARMVGLAVERDRLEERLRQVAKMEAIGVLAGGIAHDFNNYLASILGNAELILATLPDVGGARAKVDEIIGASTGAAELCDQLLAYAGRGRRDSEGVELNGLVHELSGLLQAVLPERVRLELHLAPLPLGLEGDRGQLRQVAMNLITNAAEAFDGGAGTIEAGTREVLLSPAELEARWPDSGLAAGEFVELWVRDDAGGMDAATAERVFDPFFSTKADGRGLGLAATRGIVEGHGGTITLESRLGGGTRVSVLLPRTASDQASESAGQAAAPQAPGCRILVVDDEPAVRQVLGDMLEAAGHEVLRAAGGREALELCAVASPPVDMVLLDLSMPDLDGEQVFLALRASGADVPVLLLSGYPEQEVLDRFAAHGGGLAGVLQKPVRMADLLEAVAAIRATTASGTVSQT